MAIQKSVLRPVPRGIIFKSAKTRGGTVENIVIRGMDIEGVPTPVSINLNWNPSYSYGRLPEGATDVPDYWRVLTEPVPPERGLPHFRKVRISGIRAAGAEQAFAVSAYEDAPLEDFRFEDVEIEAKAAGRIENARDWSFTRTRIRTADGSRVSLKDCRGVRGLAQE